MIIYIYPISQSSAPPRDAPPCSGRWEDCPAPPGDSDSTWSCSAQPERLPKVDESPGDPIWPSQSVPIPLGCGWRGWDCSPRIDERRGEGSLGQPSSGWKGILPSRDLWGDFSQILSFFQALREQKRDCKHGWVEHLKMCEFSVKSGKKGGEFPPIFVPLLQGALGNEPSPL